MTSINFLFFGSIRKQRWLPWPLIGQDVFNFSSRAKLNVTKFERNQVLNLLYQVHVFQVDLSTKIATIACGLLIHFVFSSATSEWNWTKLDRKQVLNIYLVCVFRNHPSTNGTQMHSIRSLEFLLGFSVCESVAKL